MHTQLATEKSNYALLKQRLLSDFPALDKETLQDTLEGITDLHEMIAAVIRSALVDEALAGGLRFRIDEMRQRFSRVEESAGKKRQLALEVMSEVGLTTLKQADFTASVRSGSPSLVVTGEEIVPKAYWISQAPKLDRQALLCQLKRGIPISGATLSNPQPVLVVRTK
jgi:hypothetical protein